MVVTIRQLGSGDKQAFERALAIYREAIEPSEQRPEDELRAALGRGDYLMLAALRHEEIVGFAISFFPPAEDFWLLEYVATTPSERGQGTGERLVREAVSVGGMRTGLVEIDEPREGLDSIPARRLRFYQRLGCRTVDGLSYLLPLRAHGVPPPMIMLALAPETTKSLSARTLERWLRIIYVQVYGQRTDDPRIARMTDGLPAATPLV